MYLYQPCLLTLALYAWAFDDARKRDKYLHALAPLAILAISGWELAFEQMYIFPSALFLPLVCSLDRSRSTAWAEVLTASVLGGLICWKVWDTWPLFVGTQPLCCMILVILVTCFCRDRKDRRLACVLGSLFFELFACLREYMLFSFCVVRLGSRESLSLGTASLCLYALCEQAFPALHRGKDVAVPAEIE